MLSTSVYAAEKMLKDNEDKISEDDKKKVVEEAIKAAKEKESSDDKDELDKAFSEFNDKIQPVGAKLYEEAAKEGDDSESSNDKKDDVVEGEVIDKKDKKTKK
jgi:molecular chaperone DnaK